MSSEKLASHLSRCRQKAQFNHPNHALSKIKEIAKKDSTPMYYYECSLCGQYHLTKSKGKNGRRV